MRRLLIKFPSQIRISGWDFGSSARAMNQAGEVIFTQADLEKVSRSTTERKSMSTKTTIKRIALVAVSALGFGMLSVVAPANAVPTGLVASVGPNGETSVTVVTGSTTDTGAVLVRLDVTTNDTANIGLKAGESITAAITAVPTGVSAKTLAENGGSIAGTAVHASNSSDLIMLETTGQSSGTLKSTAATTVVSPTDWTKTANFGSTTNKKYLDSATAQSLSTSIAVDGIIGSANSSFTAMDSNAAASTSNYVASYYVTIMNRPGASVVDKGAYTITFTLQDSNGNVRSTKTIKVDFVSSSAKSDGVITLTQTGNILTGQSYKPYDTATGTLAAAALKATLKNRDGGLIRTYDSSSGDSAYAKPSVYMQSKSTASPVWVDSPTAVLQSSDTGTYGLDWGSDADATLQGSLRAGDGVIGVTIPAQGLATSSTTGQAYQFVALYGNATAVTLATTVNSATTTAVTTDTTAIVTATGMAASDQGVKTGASTWILPTSTTSGSIKITLNNSTTAQSDLAVTVTPAWSGTYGTGAVTPAATATTVTTDAAGSITVSFSNSAPVDGVSLTLTLTGAKAFGNGQVVETIKWQKPVASTVTVMDPVTGVYLKTASSNTATVKVTDQFGGVVSGEALKVTLANTTDANYSATTAITPIVTGSAGTATFSWTGGATAATSDTFVFTSSTTSTAKDQFTATYVATVPAVATLNGYYNNAHGTSATTLVPVNGEILGSGGAKLAIVMNRNISVPLPNGATTNTTDDYVGVRFYGLTSASAAAQGAVITLTAETGGWILDASGLPVTSRNLVIGSTGYTSQVAVLATKTGSIKFTATSGSSTAQFTLVTTNAAATDSRYVNLAQSGEAVVATVTDRYGNPVAGAKVQLSTTVGTLGNGQSTANYTTDLSGKVTVNPVGQGDAVITAIGTDTGDYSSLAGYVGSTIVDSSVTKGSATATLNVTLGTVSNSDAIDAANEATDAANAATDAANAAAEAADAATAAAQDAQAAVAELATQVAALIAGIKAQITTLTNLVIKIQKKIKA